MGKGLVICAAAAFVMLAGCAHDEGYGYGAYGSGQVAAGYPRE